MIEPFVPADSYDVSANGIDQAEAIENLAHALRHARAEDSLIAVLPVVQRVVKSRTNGAQTSEIADIVQKTVLRLWSWRTRETEKSERMTTNEWEAYAASAAVNEVRRHFTRDYNHKTEVFEETVETVAQQPVVGNSKPEIESLVRLIWQEICQLSLRQRRALLLHSYQLLVFLDTNKISDADLIEMLEIPPQKWFEVKPQIPLSDLAITQITAQTNEISNLESALKSVRKARHEARTKLQHLKKK
jgi:DNA-directed RNA polymerase specialized sigma24 family protein